EWCVVRGCRWWRYGPQRWRERDRREPRTTHHAVQVSRARTYDVTGVVPVPLGVTGNTPDSGSSGCQGGRPSRATGYSAGLPPSVPFGVPLGGNLSIADERLKRSQAPSTTPMLLYFTRQLIRQAKMKARSQSGGPVRPQR